MRAYLNAVKEVLTRGTRKENRTGVDTLSTFNINYEIDLSQGFPLLTTKEMSWKNIVIENLWFLSGRTDIGLLRKHGCKFWDAWADKQGLVPSAYGNFWRNFPSTPHRGESRNDQIRFVLDELRRNRDSRRLVVSAWEPGNAQSSALPPCHALWVLNTQYDADGEPTLNLHLTQRSADIGLGVPYNIAGYAFLLELFARWTDMRPGLFAHTLVDAHVYTSKPDGLLSEFDHVPQLLDQLYRAPRTLPRLNISPAIRDLADVEALLDADTETVMNHFELIGYNPHPAIKMRVAV